ncbi:FxsA family protein [Euzebya rosea]|uniref:FxsA family protein n=1 Tax=Euzebya rosea TaxID=2052804 RepID=UPI000D3E0411|nr:FxsA family protein [Euzebya rosea]
MALLLVLCFVVIPLVEVTVIGQVQELLGWPYTIVILVADSILGAMLVKQEGTRAWRRFGEALREAKAPASEVVDGALILFGGALLLTPGFVTDIVGLACVLGPTRSLLNRLLVTRFAIASGPLGSMFLLGNRGPVDASGGRGERRRNGRRGRRTSDAEPPPSTPPPRGSSGTGRGAGADPPDVIDVEVLDVRRNPRRPEDG